MQSLRAPAPVARPFTAKLVRGPRRHTSKRFQSTVVNVAVGDKAPDFSLSDQNGKVVKLSSFQNPLFGKTVVLYFYPSDGSPGCTKQAAAFKQAFKDFKARGAEVLGISGGSVESHLKFLSDQDLPFRLLVDEGNEVRRAYGVPKDLLGLLEGRQTFVIGKDGVVKLVYNNQFNPESHVEEALSAL